MASSSRFFTSFFLKVTFFPKPRTKICTIKFNSECSTWSLILFPDLKQYSSVSSTSVYFLVIWTNPRFWLSVLFWNWISFSVNHSWIGLFLQLFVGLLFSSVIPEWYRALSMITTDLSRKLGRTGTILQNVEDSSYDGNPKYFLMVNILSLQNGTFNPPFQIESSINDFSLCSFCHTHSRVWLTLHLVTSW